jgi:hypothetical protein
MHLFGSVLLQCYHNHSKKCFLLQLNVTVLMIQVIQQWVTLTGSVSGSVQQWVTLTGSVSGSVFIVKET